MPASDNGFLDLARPAGRAYRIRVEGRVDETWSSRLGGLRIEGAQGSMESPAHITTLEGTLPDRASLLGVLNALHDLNLELVSVETIRNGSVAVQTVPEEEDS